MGKRDENIEHILNTDDEWNRGRFDNIWIETKAPTEDIQGHHASEKAEPTDGEVGERASKQVISLLEIEVGIQGECIHRTNKNGCGSGSNKMPGEKIMESKEYTVIHNNSRKANATVQHYLPEFKQD